MNEVWNLNPIYKGFDDPSFEEDLAALKENVAAFADFTETLSETGALEGLRSGIRQEERIQDTAMKLAGYASLRQAADTRNPEAGSHMGRIMAVLAGLAAPMAAFESWASKLPGLMELVKSDESLREYEFLFANMADSSRYLLPGIGEAVMAKRCSNT